MFPATHNELVLAAYRWCKKNASCGVVLKELYTMASEYPDVIGFGSGDHSVVIECKVSRNDFLADQKKPFRINPKKGMGKNRYYCCPEGLIKKEELPEGWGLIYYDGRKCYTYHQPLKEYLNRDGNTYRAIFKHKRNSKAEARVLYSALRRISKLGLIEEIYKVKQPS